MTQYFDLTNTEYSKAKRELNRWLNKYGFLLADERVAHVMEAIIDLEYEHELAFEDEVERICADWELSIHLEDGGLIQ